MPATSHDLSWPCTIPRSHHQLCIDSPIILGRCSPAERPTSSVSYLFLHTLTVSPLLVSIRLVLRGIINFGADKVHHAYCTTDQAHSRTEHFHLWTRNLIYIAWKTLFLFGASSGEHCRCHYTAAPHRIAQWHIWSVSRLSIIYVFNCVLRRMWGSVLIKCGMLKA
jgi:hypothetical protein